MRRSWFALSAAGLLLSPMVASSALAAAGAPAKGAHEQAVKVELALPFVEDNYAEALAQARKAGLPLFVDIWAPWCHSCVFMRSHVLTDPSLAGFAAQYVWLGIDTDKAQNAAFLEQFPVEGIPTLLVIDPTTEKPALKWLGNLDAAQLGRLLEDGKRAVQPAAGESAEALLARADRLYGENQAAEAAKGYRAALAAGGATWARRDRTLESLSLALGSAGDAKACAALAVEEGPKMARNSSFGNVVASGLGSALGEDWGADARKVLEPLVDEALKLPGVLADDRSGWYMVALEARKARGDEAGAKALAQQWLTFLEKAAKDGKTPAARAAFDAHRLSAAMEVGDVARAVPPLQQSARDFPKDYNPPARLALAYRELKQYDKALVEVNRALELVDGPRRLRVLDTKASIQQAKGDVAGAKVTLEQAVAHARGLPDGQRNPQAIARLEQQLKALETPARP